MARSIPARTATPAPIRFLFENSLFLISGALAALLWANLDPTYRTEQGVTVHGSYDRFIHFDLGAFAHRLFGDADPHAVSPTAASDADAATSAHAGGRFTLHFLINDVLMALFFAIAAKEVWESLLPGGALSNPRKAMTPLLATAGGVVGPAAIYAGGVLALGQWDTLGRGWAVPCATDIAFSYLFARMIFGVGHPAIAFLLLLAIADDAAGLVILAVFYPSGELQLAWLLLTVGAVALGYVFQKFLRLHSFWWYLLIPGVMSWFSFYMAGIHPALGLVPIIPVLPHAHTDLGIFAREELRRHDTLSEFEHWWKTPVEIILFFFALTNAGVLLTSVGTATWIVLGALVAGKPLGILIAAWLAERVGFRRSEGLSWSALLIVGVAAGIGFTVALFFTTAAFPPGPILDQAKLGALLSVLAGLIALLLGRVLKV